MDGVQRGVTDPILGEAEQDLMTLVDLQKFLSEELGDAVDVSTDFSQAFTPITDGLGFRSTRPKQMDPLQRFPSELPRVLQDIEPPAPPLERDRAVDDVLEGPTTSAPPKPTSLPTAVRPIARFVDESVVEDHFESSDEAPVASYARHAPSQSRLKRALGDLDKSDTLPRLDTLESAQLPPPLPSAGIFRRVMAGLVDLLFVAFLSGMVAVLAMTFISSLFSSSTALREWLRPEVLKWAVAGYMLLWLTYLSVTVGIIEATLGMWIWGLRIRYGTEMRLTKKFARVCLSLLCQAPVIPSVMLLFSRGGKNLIDSLSGSEVCRQ